MWILRGFCGDFANFLDGAHKFFFASLFGAHSRANLFPNRDLFAVGEHQNAILFPNRHNAATGEHHRATAFPNRHQITQRAQNRVILCPFVYLLAFSIISSTFWKSSGFSSNFRSSTFMMSFLPSL